MKYRVISARMRVILPMTQGRAFDRGRLRAALPQKAWIGRGLIKLQIAAVAVTTACSKISSIPNPPLEDAPWRRPLSSIAAGMSARVC